MKKQSLTIAVMYPGGIANLIPEGKVRTKILSNHFIIKTDNGCFIVPIKEKKGLIVYSENMTVQQDMSVYGCAVVIDGRRYGFRQFDSGVFKMKVNDKMKVHYDTIPTA